MVHLRLLPFLPQALLLLQPVFNVCLHAASFPFRGIPFIYVCLPTYLASSCGIRGYIRSRYSSRGYTPSTKGAGRSVFSPVRGYRPEKNSACLSFLLQSG